MADKKSPSDSADAGGVILDDSAWFRPPFSPVCTFCVHYQGANACRAFASIPDEIWYGRNAHTAPYPGDGGVRYERVKHATVNRPD